MTQLSTLAQQLKARFTEEAEAVQATPTPASLEALRIHWLGRKGELAQLYEQLKQVAKEERAAAGKAINDLRLYLESTLAQLKESALAFGIAQKLATPPLDVTLPVSDQSPCGSLHPVTLMCETLLPAFRRMGFTVFDGPEIEKDFYNFSALNIPADHPARDMQDTFFLKQDKLILRTHTSNIQIHAMLKEKPPLRLVAPGRVFRVESDATHSPMFHQIECVVVDKGISFAHLKGVIDSFLKSVFGNDLQTRFRPSFFPFVEPGAEVDLQCTMCRGKGCKICSHSGWLEVGGAGMIHPNVFEAVQYDSEDYTGFAFGFGIDRLAMLAYGLPDLRQLFAGDYRYLAQFPIVNAAAPTAQTPHFQP